MKSKKELIDILKQILDKNSFNRTELIKSFQEYVWNDEAIKDNALNEVLSEIAYDLDFYEPKEDWRRESKSFYGNDRLNAIINSGIEKIEKYVED